MTSIRLTASFIAFGSGAVAAVVALMLLRSAI